MIQVIGRVSGIIAKLAERDDLTLEELDCDSALNHGTLCNILKSLTEAGWVEKSSRGCYRLTAYFRELGNAASWEPRALNFIEKTIREFTETLREPLVVSTLRYTRVEVICQTDYRHTLMINERLLYSRLSLYTSVSGEMLCSRLTPAQREQLFRVNPPTALDLADDGDMNGYIAKLERISQTGVNISRNDHLGIKSWALPIVDREGQICASLGLSIPLTRLPADDGEGILQELTKCAGRISNWLTAEGFSSRHFLRLPIN